MLNIITDMKRIVIWSLNFTIAMFLFSSCSQKLSLTKRHYTNGYYVESKKHVNSEGLSLNKKTIVKSNLQSKKSIVDEHFKGQSTLIDLSNISNNSNSNIEKRTQLPDKVLCRTNTIHFPNDNFVNQNQLKHKPIEFDFSSQTLSAGRYDSENGLSLFWIVILVLLLLWLFGFILLSGGLINLVLALALVLLILWLLRII